MGREVPIIDSHAFHRDDVRQRVDRVAGFLELRCSAGDDVGGDAGAVREAPEEEEVELFVGGVVGDDDEEIPVAPGLRVAAGAASEEPDLFGAVLGVDAAEERRDGREVDGSVAPGRWGCAGSVARRGFRFHVGAGGYHDPQGLEKALAVPVRDSARGARWVGDHHTTDGPSAALAALTSATIARRTSSGVVTSVSKAIRVALGPLGVVATRSKP